MLTMECDQGVPVPSRSQGDNTDEEGAAGMLMGWDWLGAMAIVCLMDSWYQG
jgi:hypothetical protein